MGKAAFFDVDGTLIKCKSMLSFLVFQLERDVFDREKISKHIKKIKAMLVSEERAVVNRYYYCIFKGVSSEIIKQEGMEWYKTCIEDTNTYYQNEMKLAKDFKEKGFDIVLVTGSFEPLLEGIKRKLGVNAVLSTQPEIINNKYTGEILAKPCIGEEKGFRTKRYAVNYGIDLASSWAFGDDQSDLAMLNCVGNGVLLDRDLAH